MSLKQTAIVTGASGGIGSGLVEAFVTEGYNVVATSLNTRKSLAASPGLVLVDGDIGKKETAAKVVEAATQHFGTIDVLVNNAGISRTKSFTDFTTEDFNALVSVNLLGFLYITQLTVKQMLKQRSGNVVSITAALADQPDAPIPRPRQRRAWLRISGATRQPSLSRQPVPKTESVVGNETTLWIHIRSIAEAGLASYAASRGVPKWDSGGDRFDRPTSERRR